MEELELPRLRVLVFFVNPIGRGYIGGAERRFFEVSKALADLNVEVHALELRSKLLGYFRVSYVSHQLAHESPRGHRESILLIADFLRSGFDLFRRGRFDLILASRHDLLENLLPAWFLSVVFRVPFVVTFHHLNPNDWMSLWDLYQRRERAYRSRLRAMFLTLDDVGRRLLYRRARGCLTVSEATKSDVVEAFRLPSDKIFVSGDGVDFERLSFPSQPTKKVYDAIFVGRITGAKGVDTLLDAWKMINKLQPEARLLIVGGGESVDVKRYQKRIEQLELQRTVLMTGFLPDDQLIEMLRSSKVFVLPSYREGFGLGVAEAMACGLPVVISDIPSLRETFSGAASFFPPGNVEKLSEEILKFLLDDRLREELGKRNEAFVRRYCWESVAERELKFMESLLGKKAVT